MSAEKSYTYTVRCITANGKKFASGYDSKGFTATTSPIPPVIFDKTSVTVDKGKTYTIKTTVADKSKPITWSTSNAKVATVDQKGKVKAVGKGSAIITAEVDGIKTKCKVTVKVIKIYLSPSNQNANTYATGNTNEMAQCDKIAAATAKAHKEMLKELKFRYAHKKQAWYYHTEPYRKRSKRELTLDEIRDMFGSEKYNQSENKTPTLHS